MAPDGISPNKLRTLRKLVATARAEYELARWAALVAGRQYRARRSGAAQLVREDALGCACSARRWLRVSEARLAAGLTLTVEPFGGRVSPTALGRLRMRGRVSLKERV